jgi:hypothetical protein
MSARPVTIAHALESDRSDLEVYAAIADELGARRVLDVGCGSGSFGLLLAERGPYGGTECRRRKTLAGRLIVTGEEIHHHGTNDMRVRLLHRVAGVIDNEQLGPRDVPLHRQWLAQFKPRIIVPRNP